MWKMNKFVTIIWIFAEIFCGKAVLYDENPLMYVENGNLQIRSAHDRNVSINTNGRSTFMINNVDVLQFLHGADYANGSHSNANVLMTIREVSTQMSRMRSWIRGKKGIIARLDKLENGTTSNTGRQPGVRFGYRLSRLEDKVNSLTEKLMRDNCRSFPCQNGGTCISMFETFKCDCPKNWEGNTCSQDVNECAHFAGTDLGCQNGATCINKPGTYECACKEGWVGLHCNRRKADCYSQTSAEICGQGTCVSSNDKDGYTCICDQGWAKSNTTQACTEDIDECATSKPHCSKDPEVNCINLMGSFMCGACPAGFSGNGYYCADINECEVNNGGCSTSPTVTCINTRGSYHCGSCPIGFQGDGKICRPSSVIPLSNACDANQAALCHPSATCTQYPNALSICTCNVGYTGNGVGLNGCLPVSIDPCAGRCQNGGTCIRNGSTATCQCLHGFDLPFCTSPLDPCAVNPCLNNGVCVKIPNTSRFRCECTAGFNGIRCESQTRSCGGVYTAESGTITYPPNPNMTYQHNSRCAWLIKTNHTKILNVTFTKFNIEYSVGCKYDWLQIHDGRSSSSHIIGRFCGSDSPPNNNIISTHNSLYLWFRSDNSTSHDGFSLTWESIDPLCGGEVELKTHGALTSPGYPGNYPSNRDCEWNIIGPEGSRIQFLFFIMKIEAHENCSYDYLAIHNGIGTDTPLLGKFCNTTHPEPILTPSNKATIFFHTDGDSSDVGFQIAFSVREGLPGCGGTYTTSRGEISSLKKSDGTYHESTTCEYVIQMPVGNKVGIEFTKFSLEDSQDCKFDSIEIFEGIRFDESTLIGRFCGDDLPPKIQSSSNVLRIRFSTDWSTQLEGFELKYAMICGGVFQAESGTFTSPSYPRTYDGDQTCTYDIEAPVGKGIVLEFSDFEMETHGICEFDYLAIYDGHNENSTLIGTYCGSERPSQIVSSFNMLHLVFNVDATIGGRGFKANYSFVDVDCGGILKSPSAVLSSPMEIDSAGVYKSNAKCRWVLAAPSGYIVQINFLTFNLEEDVNCKYDFLKIFFNRTGGVVDELGPYCGSSIPSTITSVNNIVTIYFESDMSTAKEGFSASFTFVEADKICGANYFSNSGTIKSPGSPEYLSNKNCEWTITVPNGRQIELNFKSFDIEPHSTCKFDGLEIRNGGNSISPLIGLFCGTDPPVKIKSFGHQLFLKFYSDSSRNFKGFEVEWDGTSTGCGAVLDSPRGSIVSPGYPKAYPDNSQCEWRISINQGSTIKIVFTDLDLESHTDCKYDNLEIFDGRDGSHQSFGIFCNADNHPTHIETTSNHAFIRLQTDNSHGGRGFSLKYSTNCNRTLTGFDGVIESPNFPNTYPNNMDCVWKIQANSGNKIKVSFSHFDMENINVYESDSKDVCSYDHLEVRDGSITRVHCNKAPQGFTSSGDSVEIIFHTDASAGGSGFRIEWQTEGCGGYLTHSEGEITSPNYPKAYPIQVVCEWVIEVEYGYNIELTVLDLDIEHSPECEYDGLIIALDANYTHEVVKICDRKNNYTVSGNGHIMHVKFFADTSHSGRGFNAIYGVRASNCGGIFQGQNGFIYSANYPKVYNPNQICEWQIQTDDSHSLLLRFMDLDLEKTENCTKDSLEVFDAVTKKSLWRGCESQIPENNSFKSDYNKLLVVMKTGPGTVHAKGFKANYTITCGSRIVTNDSGEIIMKQDHLTSQNCTWIIKADDPSKKITLTVSYLHIHVLDEETECGTTLTIRDGETDESPIRYQDCGGKPPKAIVSNGNTLRVSVDIPPDVILSVEEFDAHYTVLDNACGGRLASEHGEFASPNWPDTSPLNMFCTWTLPVSKGNALSLTIQSLNISESDSCNDNYLEIREKDENGKLLEVLCGNKVPTNISQAAGYWVRYKTDSETVNPGFLAEYQHLHHNDLEGEQGTIESPFYPKYILLTGTRSYRISVEHGSVIHLDFPDFVLGSDICYSYMNIYDGYDSNANLLMEDHCHDIPEPVTSQTNVVYIEIFNSYGTEYRFKMNWRQVDKTSIKNETVDTCNHVITLNAANQKVNITSPGYPTGYEEAINCTWLIQSGDPAFHPIILFKDADLEETDDCTADYVSAYSDRRDGTWKQLFKLCAYDDSFPVFASGTPNLKVEFISDHAVNGTGFYATTFLECGGLMTEPSGIIDSNSAPSTERRPSFVCMWNITVKRGRTIKFQILSINLPKVDTGCLSSLYIRNGFNDGSPFLGDGRYCGTDSSVDIPETSSNRAFVKVIYNLNPVGSFKLKYEERSKECGGNVFLNDTAEISSPNYPNIPDPFSECVFTIMAPAGETIQMDFIERFDLMQNPRCEKEYVEIRDGSTENARPIGIFCQAKPPTQYSKSNVVRVKFFTNIPEPRNGFKMKLSLGKCGGTRTSRTGILASPKYPAVGAYPKKSVCEYRIIGLPNSIFDITILDIDLPVRVGGSCSETNDHIAIYSVLPAVSDSANETLSEVGKYCGIDQVPTFKSESNQLLILFKTFDSSNNYKGFSLKYNSTRLECGGTLEGESGEFTSANYPHHTSMGYCEWKITVPKGKRVKIDILDIDLLSANNRFAQRITFYNDFSHLNRIKILTKESELLPIFSSDNKMMVAFWVRQSSPNKGFRFRYSSDELTICAGNLNGRQGLIQPPISENITSFICEYARTSPSIGSSPSIGTLAITFNDMTFAGRTVYNCRFVSTAVTVEKKAPIQNNNILARFCTNQTEVTVRSPFPDTLVNVKQSPFFGRLSLTFNYKVHECGGYIRNGDVYSIRNPSISDTNYGTVDCAWFIEYDEGYTVKMNITKLDMALPCTDEYLKIYNGPTAYHPQIATYCGKNLPTTISQRSQHFYIFVEYHSNRYNPSSNFELIVEPSSTGCGGVINKFVYTITSPLVNNQYEPNAECVWEIRADPGYHIGIQFVNRFYLEDSVNCTNDYVEMFDFVDEDWISLGKVCGRNRPNYFNSTTDKMKIIFRTNDKNQAEGFTIKWEQNCGGVFKVSDQTKLIVSPGYPQHYASHMTCNYTFIAPNTEQNINIDFKDFELEFIQKCIYDNVTIYKQSEYVYPEQKEKIGTYCGTKSPEFVRNKARMEVIFVTDRWIEKRGFKFEYYLDRCRNTINSSQIISSPTKDGTYIPQLNCIWNITAPPNKKIIVRFETFSIELQDQCFFDHVEVYAGGKVEEKHRLAKLCGNLTTMPSIVVHNTSALVLMKTDQSNNFQGFSAAILFSPQCDKNIELNEASPKYDLNLVDADKSNGYDTLMECVYLVTGPRMSTISITFKEMHLSSCASVRNRTKCSCDYIEIFDGNSQFGPFMGRYCGHDLPTGDLTTASSAMFVRFVTDAARSGTGFAVTFEMRPPICGDPIIDLTNETSYEITSPGSGMYPPNLRCLWQVKSEYNRVLEIIFERFDVEDDDRCSKDYLVIDDDNTVDHITEGLGESLVFRGKSAQTLSPSFSMGIQIPNSPHTYCGSVLPHDYISQGNKINIRFVTDSEVNRSGFKLKVNIVKGCNRNYTSLQGRVTTKEIDDCLMHITVPENYTISLYFKSFQYYFYPSTCEDTNVKVYDGSLESGELLRTLCGYTLPDPIFSTKNQISIKTIKKEDISSLMFSGFDITYIASDKGPGCGGDVFNYGGLFSSPLYPNVNRTHHDCTWTVKVPRNLKVALKFNVFDMGPKITCDNDYVEFIETESPLKERMVRRFCGGDEPAVYISTQNTIKVHYKKTVNFAGTGWILYFMGIAEGATPSEW